MKVRSSSFIFTVAAFALTATFPSQAATITWGPAQNITGDTDVSTNGTLVGAVNMASAGFVVSPTVNGVTFTGASPILTTSRGIFSWDPFQSAQGFEFTIGQFAALSADYRDLLRWETYGRDFTLTMSGLTPGTEYEFQWWSNNSFATNPGPYTTLATAGSSVLLTSNLSNTSGGLGQFAIGTFIADASTQRIQFSKTQPFEFGASVNGFQLRNVTPVAPVVPEPGTALFGLSLLGTACCTAAAKPPPLGGR